MLKKLGLAFSVQNKTLEIHFFVFQQIFIHVNICKYLESDCEGNFYEKDSEAPWNGWSIENSDNVISVLRRPTKIITIHTKAMMTM